MSDVVIKTENLSKKYMIGHQAENGSYRALRDVAMDKARSMWRQATGLLKGNLITQGQNSEEVWALRDVSFEIRRGEVVGIIGRNGAGKSTLLKVLSRITEPSFGRVIIKGRVASLLEVGTGFHPELTGRENIYLNGAILGMTRSEIKRKFDEIVAFAEIERFLDTPVKRYSSGMFVRLAFAVAAHLEPEILLVDEVLAVGDVAFQKKCLGKMNEVTRDGRTVLLVSHQLAVIQTLCRRTLMFDAGQLVAEGLTQEVMRRYLSALTSAEVISLDERRDRVNDSGFRLTAIRIEDGDGRKFISSTSRLRITIDYKSDTPLRGVRFLIGLYDLTNGGIYAFVSDASNNLTDPLPPEGSVVCISERINITPGRCYVNLALQKGNGNLDYIERAAEFDIQTDESVGNKMPTRDWVLCFVDYEWFQGNGQKH